MRLGKFSKAPGDRKKYTIDYTDWLDVSETIIDIETVVAPGVGGLYVDGVVLGTDAKTVITYVSGGLEGKSYDLGIRITTSADQIKDDFVTFVVRDVPDLDFGVV